MTPGETVERFTFDYAAIDEVVRDTVKDRTAEIHGIMRITAQSIVKIGRKLAEVRPLLKAQFVVWLNCEFTWSERMAYNFIRVYEAFGDEASIANIAPSALYLLSAHSVPEETRQSAVSMAAAGESVTHKKARKLVSHYVARSNEPAKDLSGQSALTWEREGSPALWYVNRLTVAIQNGDLDMREDRLTYALHNLAELIQQRIPRHPPQ
jgi:hypothetical protein